jgi:hypothetical protein
MAPRRRLWHGYGFLRHRRVESVEALFGKEVADETARSIEYRRDR